MKSATNTHNSLTISLIHDQMAHIVNVSQTSLLFFKQIFIRLNLVPCEAGVRIRYTSNNFYLDHTDLISKYQHSHIEDNESMINLPAEDLQCLLLELHVWEVHPPIGFHEELEGPQSGLAKV